MNQSHVDTRPATLRQAFDRSFALPPSQASQEVEDLLTIRVAGDPYAILLRDIAGMVTGPRVVPVPAVTPDLLGLAGSRFPAVVSVTALRDAEDAIIGYLLIGTDNTARKQIEAEQEQLAQRLRDHQFYTRSLFESNIDALMTTDPSGIITDVNKQMEALTDCTRDELIGAPFKNYFTDPDAAAKSIKLVLSEKKGHRLRAYCMCQERHGNRSFLQRNHLV